MYSPKLLTKRRLFLWFSTFLQLFNFLASSLSDSSESFVIPPPSTKVSLSGWKKIKSTVLITNQLFFRNLVKMQHVKIISFKVHIFWAVKMFLKPVWEGKMHGVTKIGIFRPLFCVNMLGKSTNYSTGTRPLCSTFWAK